MPKIIPFRALRPEKSIVAEVASQPYDVLDIAEVRELTKNNEKSFLHVIRSEVDLPESVDVHDERVYEKARENLCRFMEENVLLQDKIRCFYVYRQKMGEHVQDGLVACVSAEDYESNLIKKHELTRADKQRDRTRHIEVLNAQTGPVFLTYRSSRVINEIVAAITDEEPEYSFIADDEIEHTLWVVDDEAVIAELVKGFDQIASLYIADGHHRTASAAAVAGKRRKMNSAHEGTEEYNYLMAVIFPHDQLKVLDYNRVVKDLNGLTGDEFIDRISESFVLEADRSTKRPTKKHTFGMYVRGKWYALMPKELKIDNKGIVESLDVSILEKRVLKPLLGIEDVRTDERISFVGGIRGMEELERLVDSGDYAVAFSMYPVDIDELLSVSDAGEIMPPKSTWFEPKLRSGLFVHLID